MIRVDTVRIRNYKSIRDSGEVNLENDVTALIGQNESGKTNFLEALQSFNRGYTYSEEELCSYIIQDLRSRKDSQIPIISITFNGTIPNPFVPSGAEDDDCPVQDSTRAGSRDGRSNSSGVGSASANSVYRSIVARSTSRCPQSDSDSKVAAATR
jgi:hypothetical protein